MLPTQPDHQPEPKILIKYLLLFDSFMCTRIISAQRESLHWVLCWRLRFCVAFILWQLVCLIKHVSLSQMSEAKLCGFFPSVPYVAPASAVLKECIFSFFFLQNNFCLHLALIAPRLMPWPLLRLISSLSLLARLKVQTIFQLPSALPCHSLSTSQWWRQTLLEATPIPHLTPGVLPLSFHQLLKNYSFLQISERPVALASSILRHTNQTGTAKPA